MTLHTDREFELLQEQNARLLRHVAVMKQELFEPSFADPAWGLQGIHRKILDILMRADVVTRDGLTAAVWPSHEFEQRNPQTIESHVSRLRQRLAHMGVMIKNERHVGYWMDGTSKAVIRAKAEKRWAKK